MTYQQWVDKVGAQSASKTLGRPITTVRMWYSLDRFPRPRQLINILDKTGGVIDVEPWVRAFVEKNAANEGEETC